MKEAASQNIVVRYVQIGPRNVTTNEEANCSNKKTNPGTEKLSKEEENNESRQQINKITSLEVSLNNSKVTQASIEGCSN